MKQALLLDAIPASWLYLITCLPDDRHLGQNLVNFRPDLSTFTSHYKRPTDYLLLLSDPGCDYQSNPDSYQWNNCFSGSIN